MSTSSGLFAHTARDMLPASIFEMPPFKRAEPTCFKARTFSFMEKVQNSTQWRESGDTSAGLSRLLRAPDSHNEIGSVPLNSVIGFNTADPCSGCDGCRQGVRDQSLLCKSYFF
jgi:hypothetical protein